MIKLGQLLNAETRQSFESIQFKDSSFRRRAKNIIVKHETLRGMKRLARKPRVNSQIPIRLINFGSFRAADVYFMRQCAYVHDIAKNIWFSTNIAK